MFFCVVCGIFGLSHICPHCLKTTLSPTFSTRTLGNLAVHSFYRYSDIEPLILYKHQLAGSFIFKRLASITFTSFARHFSFDEPVSVLPIDDTTKNGYSHTAILAHAMKSSVLRPAFHHLHAQNPVHYAGQNLLFRQQHPRNFRFTRCAHKNVILVDDIVTTGSTLKEAARCVSQHGYDVLCAVVLADADERR